MKSCLRFYLVTAPTLSAVYKWLKLIIVFVVFAERERDAKMEPPIQ
jgi:hypothetical protein